MLFPGSGSDLDYVHTPVWKVLGLMHPSCSLSEANKDKWVGNRGLLVIAPSFQALFCCTLTQY